MSLFNSKSKKSNKVSNLDDSDISGIQEHLGGLNIINENPSKKPKNSDYYDKDDESGDDTIPEISLITNIEDIHNDFEYDDDNIDIIEDNGDEDDLSSVLEVDDIKPKKKTTKKSQSGTGVTKARKTPGLASIYSKRKDNAFNLKRLKEHLQLSETSTKNTYSYSNRETFIKSFKFPTWASIAKKSNLNNLEHLTLVITDDSSIEIKLKQDLISEICQNNQQPSVLFLNVNPYTAFIKLFTDLKSPVLSFSVLQSIISLFLIADKIVFSTKFPTSSYVFFLLAQKINVSEKIIFKPENIDNDKSVNEYSNEIKEYLSDFNVDTTLLCNFLKLNNVPSTYNERIILDIFKMFNFKSQLKYESFDGLTKTLFRCIKKNQLYKKPFNFLTLINEFALEYPMIPEKDILSHYIYIINNFGQSSSIPLFSFANTDINKKTPIQVNQDMFNKILSITVIVKKSYGEYWSCLLPCQLFYGKDFYSLDLKTLIKYFIENDTNRLIMDNDGKMYKYAQNDGIIVNKSVYQLELSGPDNNILRYTDPTITREEFILKLIQKNIPYVIKNNNIVIQDVKKVSRYLKFSLDKENTIFDFKNVIVMGKNTDKVNHYNNVLKYYNDYTQFNMKLFKCYMIQCFMLDNANTEKYKMLKDFYKREIQTTALLHSGNYPASYDIDEENMIFDTTFFEGLDTTNIDVGELSSEECLNFIKNKLKEFYNSY